MDVIEDVGDDELARLRDRVADLERFIRRLGHDLTTPLTTVAGFASLLVRDAGLPPNTVDSIRRIHSSADRANRMLRALVDETRLHEAESVFVRDAINAAAEGAVDLGVEMHLEAPTTPSRVFVMRATTVQLLRTIFVGLAARCAPDALAVSLTISEPEVGDVVSISFATSSGAGFTEAERNALDEAHIEEADDELPMLAAIRLAARLATTQAGRLWAEDVEGGGIRLILALPRSTGYRG